MANTVVIMPNEPLWLQATGVDPVIPYSSTNDRWLIDALFANEGTVGASVNTSLQVFQRGAGANFSVDVAIGSAIILGGDTANQGKYLVRSNAVTNVATPSAPGAGTRVHRIIARVRDKQAVGSGTYDWTLELLEDTGSGTPAEPVSAISLALVSISVGQASVLAANITDAHTAAQGYGSLVPSVKVYTSGNVPNTTDVACTFVAAFWNKGVDGPMWASGSPTILTVKTPGIYRVSAQCLWTPNITGIRTMKIEKALTPDNTKIIAISEVASVSSLDACTQQCSVEYPFFSGDNIILNVFQNSGGILALVNTDFGSTLVDQPNWLSATFIQPL